DEASTSEGISWAEVGRQGQEDARRPGIHCVHPAHERRKALRRDIPMNIGNITNAVTRFGHRGVLVTKKYSPQILTGVGIVSGIASTVLASKATLQLEDKIDDMRKHVENAN